MAWTTPRSWVAAELVTASLLNTHLRDNLLALRAASVFTEDSSIATGKKFYLDGGSNTYLYENTADIISYYCGGTLCAQMTTAGVILPPTFRLYLDGGSDTYIAEASANVISFVCANAICGQVAANGLSVPATFGVYLDGGSDTYLTESSANTLAFYAGGSNIFSVVKPAGAGYVTATGGYAMATWPTVAGSANVIAANGDVLKIATSLRQFKREIETITTDTARAVVMSLNPVTFRSAVDADPRVWPGFIAEEVEPVTPTLVIYAPDGPLQSVAYDRVPAYLVPVAQDHERRIAALEARVR